MISALAVAALSLGLAQQTDTTFNVPASGSVAIENFGGSVNVRAWDRAQMRVRARHSSRTALEIDVRGARVDIDVSGRMGPGQAEIEVTVPRAYGVRIEGVNTEINVDGANGELNLETVNGNITVRGGRGRIQAESIQGAVRLEDANGRIQVSSTNQGIRLRNVVGDISAESVNGAILMYGVDSRAVAAETVNGAIEFEGRIYDNGHYGLATHNGRIVMAMPANANANVSVYTFNGKLSTGFDVDVRQSRSRGQFGFTLGRGGADVELESFGGSIQLVRPSEIQQRDLNPRRSN
ncbi:MAG TPA: hypothetical protein VK939_12480 [Longimicrobiales bacterium]|nr:hypothetical protein [Longimicrobiales bacterium]